MEWIIQNKELIYAGIGFIYVVYKAIKQKNRDELIAILTGGINKEKRKDGKKPCEIVGTVKHEIKNKIEKEAGRGARRLLGKVLEKMNPSRAKKAHKIMGLLGKGLAFIAKAL